MGGLESGRRKDESDSDEWDNDLVHRGGGGGKPYDRLKECTLVGLLLGLFLCAAANDEFVVWAIWATCLHTEGMLTPWSLRILETNW